MSCLEHVTVCLAKSIKNTFAAADLDDGDGGSNRYRGGGGGGGGNENGAGGQFSDPGDDSGPSIAW
jgi:hypothetical protein